MVPTPQLQSRKRKILIAALVCLNVVLLVVGARYLLGGLDNPKQNEELLPYDSELASLPEQIVAASGKDWRLLVVVFVKVQNPILRLRYLETVYQRHNKSGLSVVGVCRSTPDEATAIKQRFDLSFPIISDMGAVIHTALHFPTPGLKDGVMLIDSSHKVKYSDETMPSEDSLRILVEKYLFNSVDYSYHSVSPSDSWRLGGKLPAVQLRDIRTGAETTLEGGGFTGKTLVIYFTGCAPCRLQNYLNNLASLEKETTEKLSLTAIFPANFATQDLLSYAQKLQIQSPIFVMAGGNESADEYVTRYETKVNEPFLVRVGKTGLITGIDPLDGDAH